ncbi:uncharacterized protein RHOBADRAFT_52176 [Rhodotorula graminis WP1]|uniref:Uncharacterized protein n=1 Tax=Rhodotorula graminis (strain WP1) TaxID=578459 RepID=A0A194SCW8_RHOGW|nr:uncharacterized protein RHOBADRAFT_52175 [Rhodotorula graminis WP1]XP_018273290.1 uncharacterized protein RHOBADRAFT_52176 [Rhodotorula graminis WP1]KPV77239.1 hypothetical protein RHOBADRAFT_52175 [Rhodotorula graminis WP1]KPV77241.1 hypothetical protein RHOBADRAFT_52176 [Rhodotorula graminis WP1]
MLTKTLIALTIAGTALNVAALPSGGGKGGYGGGYDDYGLGDGIISASDYSQKNAEESLSYREICYRNLYADVEAFKLRTDKEVAIKDAGNADVFLFANFKKDYQDKEFYYEEFCYKQTHKKEHNSKVSADSVLVGLKEKRDGGIGNGLGGGLGLGGGIGLGGGLDGISGGGLNGIGGFDGAGSLDSASFLDGGFGDYDNGLGGGFGGSSSLGGGGFSGGFDGGIGGGIGGGVGGSFV